MFIILAKDRPIYSSDLLKVVDGDRLSIRSYVLAAKRSMLHGFV